MCKTQIWFNDFWDTWQLYSGVYLHSSTCYIFTTSILARHSVLHFWSCLITGIGCVLRVCFITVSIRHNSVTYFQWFSFTQPNRMMSKARQLTLKIFWYWYFVACNWGGTPQLPKCHSASYTVFLCGDHCIGNQYKGWHVVLLLTWNIYRVYVLGVICFIKSVCDVLVKSLKMCLSALSCLSLCVIYHIMTRKWWNGLSVC
jgi:hypothetical protein